MINGKSPIWESSFDLIVNDRMSTIWGVFGLPAVPNFSYTSCPALSYPIDTSQLSKDTRQ